MPWLCSTLTLIGGITNTRIGIANGNTYILWNCLLELVVIAFTLCTDALCNKISDRKIIIIQYFIVIKERLR